MQTWCFLAAGQGYGTEVVEMSMILLALLGMELRYLATIPDPPSPGFGMTVLFQDTLCYVWGAPGSMDTQYNGCSMKPEVHNEFGEKATQELYA